jgi:hypothetical protein
MSRQPLHLEPKRWSVVLTADRWTDMATSASGTKRNCLGAHGISGAEGRPAVPSTWRRQPPLTQSSYVGSLRDTR